MNEYSFEEINLNQEESFSVSVTEEMMNKFLDITGDINPLHTDIEFAKSKGYNNKVVYGMLTSSFLSTLAGVYLPGKNSLIQSVETLFKKPVFPGDTLLIKGQVVEKFDNINRITVKVTITNDRNEKVCRGTMQIGVLNGIL